VRTATLTYKTPKKWSVTVTATKKRVSDRDVLAELKALVAELEAKLNPSAEAA
jgi:hypothetical protein